MRKLILFSLILTACKAEIRVDEPVQGDPVATPKAKTTLTPIDGVPIEQPIDSSTPALDLSDRSNQRYELDWNSVIGGQGQLDFTFYSGLEQTFDFDQDANGNGFIFISKTASLDANLPACTVTYKITTALDQVTGHINATHIESLCPVDCHNSYQIERPNHIVQTNNQSCPNNDFAVDVPFRIDMSSEPGNGTLLTWRFTNGTTFEDHYVPKH